MIYPLTAVAIDIQRIRIKYARLNGWMHARSAIHCSIAEFTMGQKTSENQLKYSRVRVNDSQEVLSVLHHLQIAHKDNR